MLCQFLEDKNTSEFKEKLAQEIAHMEDLASLSGHFYNL